MNRYLLISILAIAFASLQAQVSSVRNLSSEKFRERSHKGSLLDVRTPSEFSNGHIAGAGQLNYYSLNFKQKLLLLPKDEAIYLYCNTGYRSKRAAKFLVENGYNEVYNLERGIMEWNLADLPVVVEPDARADEENKMEPDEFYALIESNETVLIDFYAPWCAPCRNMMPMIDSLKMNYKHELGILKINVDASKKLVKELQIGSVPYLVLYKGGLKAFEHNGSMLRNDLEKVIKRNTQGSY